MATGATTRRSFPPRILAQLCDSKILRIRASSGDDRFISIWVVVMKDRVFVRSWSVRPTGWYRAFSSEAQGAIRIADRDISVVAVPTTDKRILDAIDPAYLNKYNTPGAIKDARDLGRPQSRAATLELRPFQPIRKSRL
jgi:hypothetical protein